VDEVGMKEGLKVVGGGVMATHGDHSSLGDRGDHHDRLPQIAHFVFASSSKVLLCSSPLQRFG
jgi:hypothetical protein